MKKQLDDMTLEELTAERDRLNHDMFMAGSPSLSTKSSKCSACDWGYGDKIKEVNEQIEIAKKAKTMCFREWLNDNEK